MTNCSNFHLKLESAVLKFQAEEIQRKAVIV